MRYPVRNGLAIPTEELGFERVPHQRRLTTNHHSYFCREQYKDSRVKQIFRGLLPHVVTLSISDHMELHERYSAPIMPRDGLMIDVIDEYLSLNGVIDVVREKRTNETYEILPEQWNLIRNGGNSGTPLYTTGNQVTHRVS